MYRVQPHGATAHEAVGGRHCQTPVCPFGEHVHWKRQADGINSTEAESEWFDGVVSGMRPVSGECIVGSSAGVVYCRTVRRVIDADRWSKQATTEVSQNVREVERASWRSTTVSINSPDVGCLAGHRKITWFQQYQCG